MGSGSRSRPATEGAPSRSPSTTTGRASRRQTRRGVPSLLPDRSIAQSGDGRHGPGPLDRARHRARSRRGDRARRITARRPTRDRPHAALIRSRPAHLGARPKRAAWTTPTRCRRLGRRRRGSRHGAGPNEASKKSSQFSPMMRSTSPDAKPTSARPRAMLPKSRLDLNHSGCTGQLARDSSPSP